MRSFAVTGCVGWLRRVDCANADGANAIAIAATATNVSQVRVTSTVILRYSEDLRHLSIGARSFGVPQDDTLIVHDAPACAAVHFARVSLTNTTPCGGTFASYLPSAVATSFCLHRSRTT